VSQFRSDVQDQWFHANDLYVLPGTPIKTVSDTAYILVYQRIN
jgi:ubiquitin C-terminal hydrolase